MSVMSIIAASTFILFPVLSVPITHALLAESCIAMLSPGQLLLSEAILDLYQPMSSFPMLAIPLFILAGDIMMSGQFGSCLIKFSKMLVGWIKSGLALVSVLGSLFIGCIWLIGVIMLVITMAENLAIRLSTPPVGTALFVSLANQRVPMSMVVFRLWPFHLVALVWLGLVRCFPAFPTLLLP